MPKSAPFRLDDKPPCGRPWREHIVKRGVCRAAIQPCEACVRFIMERWLGAGWWDSQVTESGACRKCGEPFYGHIEFGPFVVTVSTRPDGEPCEVGASLERCHSELQIWFPQRVRECGTTATPEAP